MSNVDGWHVPADDGSGGCRICGKSDGNTNDEPRELTTFETVPITGRPPLHTVFVGDEPVEKGQRILLDHELCEITEVMMYPTTTPRPVIQDGYMGIIIRRLT